MNAQLTRPSTIIEISRQDKVYAWLRREKLTFAKMAGRLSVTSSTARSLLLNDTAPTHRVRQLREAGVPEELLPAPLDIPPGPKPKINLQNCPATSERG